jgi:hypothetical protein
MKLQQNKYLMINTIFIFNLIILLTSCGINWENSNQIQGVSSDNKIIKINNNSNNKFLSLGESSPLITGKSTFYIILNDNIRGNPTNYYIRIQSDTGENLYSGNASGLMWNKSKNFPINISYNKYINIDILNKKMSTKETDKIIINKESNTLINI